MLLVMVCFCFIFPGPNSAFAATSPTIWYVSQDGTGDGTSWKNASGSLRLTIAKAQASDEIWVAKGEYMEAIELKRPVELYGGFQGYEPERSWRDPQTHITVIDATAKNQSVITIDGIENTIIDGFTVRSGKSAKGGGIFYRNVASGTLRRCIVTDNHATLEGGGVYCENASPRLVNCTIVGNFAETGCGLFANFSSPHIVNCILWNRKPDIDYVPRNDPELPTDPKPVVEYSLVKLPYEGSNNIEGDVYPMFADPLNQDFTLKPGSPCIDMGARELKVKVENTTLEPLPRLYVSNNPIISSPTDEFHTITEAIDYSFWVFRFSSEIWVAPGTYEENIALHDNMTIYGGRNKSDASSKQPYIPDPSQTILIGTKANEYHTVSIQNVDNTTLQGFTITNNNSDKIGNGAGLYYAYSEFSKLSDCIIKDNAAVYNGAGLNAFYSTVEIEDCAFTNNTAANGAGVYCFHSGIGLNNCDFSDNVSFVNGGAAFIKHSSALVVDSSFTVNDAASGGALYLVDSLPWPNSMVLQGCYIAHNFAAVGGGGVICDNASPLIEGCVIFSNYTDQKAGGIGIHNISDATLTNNLFIFNQARYGGGLFIDKSSPLVTCCDFFFNDAVFNGGGIQCQKQSDPQIIACLFWDNWGFEKGGAVYSSDAQPTLANCVLANNYSAIGGGLYCDNESHADVINCSIVDNYASKGTGLFASKWSIPSVTNCIFWNYDNDIHKDFGYLIVNYSCIKEGFEGTDNITSNPLFEDARKGNYELQLKSPCNDAGADNEVYYDHSLPPGKKGPRNDMGYTGGGYNYLWDIPAKRYPISVEYLTDSHSSRKIRGTHLNDIISKDVSTSNGLFHFSLLWHRQSLEAKDVMELMAKYRKFRP